ncbi:unnamed protein product [Blepharisma stoltei]|uniref:Uncharacterized protein n=1 Tax=Blepharisma stoltei TaxID=1481888 RepID=A0AAU9J1Y2_9CILI|nr:unnamed protein product [Blepharisma stoltei]
MFRSFTLVIIFAFLSCSAVTLVSFESVDIVSDESWTVQGTNYMGKAVEAWNHPQWTSISGAKWIWKSFYAEDPWNGETYMFQKEFSINGLPTQSSLTIAADDSFALILNGNLVASSQNWNEGQAQTFNVQGKLLQGRNTVQVVVSNYVRDGHSQFNTGGLLFKLTVTWLNI